MRTLLATTFFFLAITCRPAGAVEGFGPPASNDPRTAAVETSLDSILIDRFGAPTGLMSDRGIRRELAYLSARSQQLDPAHHGVMFQLRGPPDEPKPPGSSPPHKWVYRPMNSWQYVPLRVLLNYLCKANGLNYDIEDGQVVLFHPDQKVIIL
jgi:hypothetical protein